MKRITLTAILMGSLIAPTASFAFDFMPNLTFHSDWNETNVVTTQREALASAITAPIITEPDTTDCTNLSAIACDIKLPK